MSEPTITCPNCKSRIRLTESVAAPLIRSIREQYEQKIAHQESDLAKREVAIREQQAVLASAKAGIERRVADARAELVRRQRELDDAKREMNLAIERKVQGSLESVRQKAQQEAEDALKPKLIQKDELIASMQRDVEVERRIATEEAEKARLLISSNLERTAKEVADLQRALSARDSKLAEAQNAQAELIRKQRELDDAKREVELTVEKRVQESLVSVRNKAKQEAEDALRLRLAEKEQLIASMQRQVEELKRKSEQGSQQLQGEVQEIELESLLRNKFPVDLIEPVAKGEFGGDVLQRVTGPLNQHCGTILWEIKRTKNWSEGWLAKLRDDQRAAKANIALLVSHAIPKGIDAFDYVDGVWVTEPRCALPVAIALRQSLIEIEMARAASAGQQTKMGLVYEYMTGPLFRQRVEAIVEKFSDMQVDLAKERKTMTRLWAKRESQIRGVIESTVGMYGDLQGIAGRALQEIEGLDIRLLDPPKSDADEEKGEEGTIGLPSLGRNPLAPKEGNGGIV
jgi:hypothetical protein